jgi:hypothetical protein
MNRGIRITYFLLQGFGASACQNCKFGENRKSREGILMDAVANYDRL